MRQYERAATFPHPAQCPQAKGKEAENRQGVRASLLNGPWHRRLTERRILLATQTPKPRPNESELHLGTPPATWTPFESGKQ